jgi:hypothetical protein
MRQLLQGLGPNYGDPMIEEFVQGVFSDQSIVDAYFFPKPITGLMNAAELHTSGSASAWIPLEVASRAAAQAQMMGLIRPYERRLTHLGTFLYPCGLFHCARIEVLSGQENTVPSFEQIETMRGLLLEESLRRLKTHHQGLPSTLAAVLGLPHDEDINEEQVARIASAVYLANVKVTAIWTAGGKNQ